MFHMVSSQALHKKAGNLINTDIELFYYWFILKNKVISNEGNRKVERKVLGMQRCYRGLKDRKSFGY